MFPTDDDDDAEHRLTLSGGEEDEAEEKEDEKWRVERLEREKWMQGTNLGFDFFKLMFYL